MPSLEKQEGLVLRRIDYKDQQKILTLFTKERGVISLIVKRINRKNPHLLTLSSPFTQGEYLYQVGRTHLYTFQDGTPLNHHFNLRKSLPLLEAATQMAQALLISQLPEKPSPHLYQLVIAYLNHLPQMTTPSALTASFLLKLLKHEGLLSLTPTCAYCASPPTHLYEGESLCSKHTSHPAVSFSEHEWMMLVTLLEARQFEALKIALTPPLAEKVTALFHSFFSS